MLGTEDDHLAFFTSAALGHLSDAVTAGAKFAGGKVNKGPSEAAAALAANVLARNVVTMLRRRIEATDSGEDVSAHVGAAFREWRGERIERLVGDCAVQSFSAGVLAGATKKGTVRWILTSTDGCSDCDDNRWRGRCRWLKASRPVIPLHPRMRAVGASSRRRRRELALFVETLRAGRRCGGRD